MKDSTDSSALLFGFGFSFPFTVRLLSTPLDRCLASPSARQISFESPLLQLQLQITTSRFALPLQLAVDSFESLSRFPFSISCSSHRSSASAPDHSILPIQRQLQLQLASRPFSVSCRSYLAPSATSPDRSRISIPLASAIAA